MCWPGRWPNPSLGQQLYCLSSWRRLSRRFPVYRTLVNTINMSTYQNYTFTYDDHLHHNNIIYNMFKVLVHLGYYSTSAEIMTLKFKITCDKLQWTKHFRKHRWKPNCFYLNLGLKINCPTFHIYALTEDDNHYLFSLCDSVKPTCDSVNLCLAEPILCSCIITFKF